MREHAPRVSLHDDGLVVSIGFTDTNDTLLWLEGAKSAARYKPEVDRDRGDMARLREWVESTNDRLSERDEYRRALAEIEASHSLAEIHNIAFRALQASTRPPEPHKRSEAAG